MAATIGARLQEFLSSRVMDLRSGLLDRYVELFTQEIGLRLEKELGEITQMKQEAAAEHETLQRLRGELTRLASVAETSRRALPTLAEQFLPQPEPEPLEELEELDELEEQVEFEEPEELQDVELAPMNPFRTPEPGAEDEASEPAPAEAVEVGDPQRTFGELDQEER
jgi:hypothetical protein